MDIVPLDPRDASWEVAAPTYWVYFWTQLRASGPWLSEEYELSGVDAPEVLAWAAATVGDDRTYTVYACCRWGDQLGLVRLAGTDPI
jgi:hypothetical protein